MSSVPDILKRIVEHKREEVAAAKSAMSLSDLKSHFSDREDQPRGFLRALKDAAESGWTPIIAEVKKGSPSKGIIRPDFDPLEIASTYQDNGATCISVLTDEKFFLGNLRYIALIREQVGLPLLRKDFLFDPYQIYEASVAGADAILLIAAMLEPSQLSDLAAQARELQLDVLLEVHDERELEMAMDDTDCELIGINNRSLHTFETDLSVTERLAQMMPAENFVVSESGINSRADIERLQRAGADGFLVGESLMREEDIGKKLQELLT
jgi:indole-3-glycerol phosphate synthase